MKTKINYTLGCVILSVCLFSCQPHRESPDDPTIEINHETCLNALLPYFPYSGDEEFIFVNDELGQTWEALAYDYDKGTYPYTESHMEQCSNEDGKPCDSNGFWESKVTAWFVSKEMSPKIYNPGEMSAFINYMAGEYLTYWVVDLRLTPNLSYMAGVLYNCPKNEVLSNLVDTIYLPIPFEDFMTPYRSIPPSGSYARIVRNKGLTDFCVDGKTVWRRVK